MKLEVNVDYFEETGISILVMAPHRKVEDC